MSEYFMWTTKVHVWYQDFSLILCTNKKMMLPKISIGLLVL